MTFGEYVRMKRKAKGLSTKEFRSAINNSLGLCYISSMELKSRAPSAPVVCLIAHAIGEDPHLLLSMIRRERLNYFEEKLKREHEIAIYEFNRKQRELYGLR